MIILFFVLISFTNNLFSQVDTSANKPLKTDYLRRSKTQSIVGWTMLGFGTTMVVTGVITVRKNLPRGRPSATLDGVALVGLGLLLDLGSIPLFASASKNKRKAVSLSLKHTSIHHLSYNTLLRKSVPAVRMTLQF